MAATNSTRRDSELELAWAAGFFDGEGCVGLFHAKSGKIYLQLSVAQGDERPLLRFQQAVGVGKIYGPYVIAKAKTHWKPRWTYRVYGNDKTVKILNLLWPYLSDPKRDQAQRKWDEVNAQAA